MSSPDSPHNELNGEPRVQDRVLSQLLHEFSRRFATVHSQHVRSTRSFDIDQTGNRRAVFPAGLAALRVRVAVAPNREEVFQLGCDVVRTGQFAILVG